RRSSLRRTDAPIPCAVPPGGFFTSIEPVLAFGSYFVYDHAIDGSVNNLFYLASRRGIDMTSTREPAASVVRFAPMHDQILPHLRRDIVENRWKSGERLSEPLLCKQFGVSRTPLRQALKTLEAEGLVRLVPHVGAVVTDPGATEIGETMEILIGLEQLAAI